MLEAFIVILIVGVVLYHLLRHPIKTVGYIWNTLGIIVLGVLGIVGFFFMVYGIIHFL